MQTGKFKIRASGVDLYSSLLVIIGFLVLLFYAAIKDTLKNGFGMTGMVLFILVCCLGYMFYKCYFPIIQQSLEISNDKLIAQFSLLSGTLQKPQKREIGLKDIKLIVIAARKYFKKHLMEFKDGDLEQVDQVINEYRQNIHIITPEVR